MYFVLIILFFSAPVSWGKALSCEGLYSSTEQKRIKHPEVYFYADKDWKIIPEKEKNIKILFEDLAQLTQSKISLPQELKVTLRKAGDGAAYDHGVIYAPDEFIATKYHKHPLTTQTVLSHEWGHALLEQNLAERFPAIKKQMQLEEQQAVEFRKIFYSYNELFADVVPVIYKKDGHITRDPLFSYAHSNKENEDALMRDFTRKHKLKGWSLEGSYAMLAPTRSFLWQEYLSKPHVQKKSGLALEALIEAIGEEVNYRLHYPAIQFTPEAVNRRLMDAVAKQMQKRNL